MELLPANVTGFSNGPKIRHGAEKIRQERKQIFLQSKFNFLMQHNGLRPSCNHLLISSAGVGKTTLVCAIAAELIDANEEVFFWLSEEKPDAYASNLMNALKDPKKVDTNVNFFCEVEEPNLGKYIEKPELFFEEVSNRAGNPSLIIFDNLTTSAMYLQEKYSKRSKFYQSLKALAYEKQCPILSIAHTQRHINEQFRGIIEPEDVAEGNNPVKFSEFVYCFQSFRLEDERIIATVRVKKNRGYVNKTSFYLLDFDRYKLAYVGDREAPWEMFKELLGKRMTYK